MNHVVLIGRLTRDPEARQTPNGVSTSKFTIAVKRDYRNSNGGYDSDFINCVAWRGTADFVNRYIGKGRMVAVEGSIQTGSYNDRNGVKKYTFDVRVNGVEALDRAPQNNAGNANAPADEPEQQAQTMEQQGFEEVEDDSLPF